MQLRWITIVLFLGVTVCASDYPVVDGAFEVRHPAEIQPAIELAGQSKAIKRVVVQAGTYRPMRKGQALIWFNKNHDGVTVEAKGEVILTAANGDLADRSASSFPAIVNHVVYFGDGVSRKTVLKGFKITGANNFVSDIGGRAALEPNFEALRKTEGFYAHIFFFTDGGGVKIFGRSYPTIEQVEILNSFSSPCGGGISIEHRGFKQDSVLLKNCIFRGNRALVTGSAVDLLPGSSAEITNCLFVSNISNTGDSYTIAKGNIDWPEIPRLVATTLGYQPKHGSGALTVFPRSQAVVTRCTFTANANGVDDKGGASVYSGCIFFQNTARGGVRKGAPYEFDVSRGTTVTNCFVRGDIEDVSGAVKRDGNAFSSLDPGFDPKFNPQNPAFAQKGYRSVR